MSSAAGGDSGQGAAQGVQKLVDLASRELQKRVVAQNLLAESSGVREQARALRQSDGDAPAGPSQEELDRFSFLWNGPEPERTVHELPAQTREDLQLAGIVRAMAIHGSAERYLTALLGAQLSTVEQIGHRQSVLQAILAHPPLEEVVREATLRVILAGPLTTMDNRAALYRVVNHLSELELYVATTEALADALTAVGDAGPVWSELAALLDRIRETAAHRQLLSFLPGVLADVRGMASITIGVNLDAQLRPVEATLLSVNRERFKGSKLMSTVLGKAAAEGRGIADLHSLLRPGHAKPLVRELFDDLAQVLDRAARQLAGEAAYLMLDIVRVLVALGCRSVLATHLHELAAWVEDEQVPGAFNLAATTREVPVDGAARVVPTFRVERAPPAGHSHARAVARDNGLLFEQIVDSLRERGQLDRPVASPG